MYVLFYICGAAAAACQLLNKRICYVLCYVMHLQQQAQSQSTNAGSNITYTSDTIDQQHKAQTKKLKASNAKNGSHEFPEFLFRNFGTWGETEFPEIRKSEFPELQSLATRSHHTILVLYPTVGQGMCRVGVIRGCTGANGSQ